MTQGALGPSTLMSNVEFEHGVCYGQSMTITEALEHIQIWQAVPPDHPLPCYPVIPDINSDVAQKDYGVRWWHPFPDPTPLALRRL